MLVGFLTIVVVIACGAALAQAKLLDRDDVRLLGELAFFVATPALMVVTIARIDLGQAGVNVAASALALAACFVSYAVLATVLWRPAPGELVIGSLSASYVNAGNLGVAISAYVIGDITVVVPTLLVQMLVVQPACLVVLDRVGGGASNVAAVVRRVVTNPLTVAAVVGAVLAVSGWSLPQVVDAPLQLLAGAAIPLMLLAYGAALRLSPGVGLSGHRGEVVLASTLKLAVMPVVAWAVASALGLDGPALLGVVLTAALPTAQNVFVFATRYRVGEDVSRETVLVTTVAALPLAMVVAWLLG
ncbi:AEC family transporter [Janibacter sp. YIM B02568]|uniref:AEC family transporter n=1 Tax=Janibacter endophyticus TaxID=2806261 RepID=UPI00194E5291|nr:AEC family transporter [Janibacter endophyticus]MBM6545105.1 AEC family transporter [Janibacter endophyticus]